MPDIIEPFNYATEERLRIPISGSERCIVVSGYANFSDENDSDDGHPLNSKLHGAGTGSSDHRWFGNPTVHLIVGPKLHEIKDVSPIVNVGGWSFRDSDETDHTGFEITSCTWDSVSMPEPEQALKRVRLKIESRMCGGEQSSVTILSYHFVVIGKLFATVG